MAWGKIFVCKMIEQVYHKPVFQNKQLQNGN